MKRKPLNRILAVLLCAAQASRSRFAGVSLTAV